MENNWKWYEQSDSERQAQQNAKNAQDAQGGYNPNQAYYGSDNNGYAQSYWQKPSKPKKYVTFTQMIVAIVVAAFLFTGAGLLIGKGANSNNITQQEASSV